MAAAAGKKSPTSLTLFMEAHGFEVEQELSTMATQDLCRRSMDRKMELRAMCETRDLDVKWPHWHTLMFSDEIKIDMRFVCPKDVKKMLVQRAPISVLEEVGSKARV